MKMLLRHASSKQHISPICLSQEFAAGGWGVGCSLDNGGNQEKIWEPGNGRVRGSPRIMVMPQDVSCAVNDQSNSEQAKGLHRT